MTDPEDTQLKLLIALVARLGGKLDLDEAEVSDASGHLVMVDNADGTLTLHLVPDYVQIGTEPKPEPEPEPPGYGTPWFKIDRLTTSNRLDINTSETTSRYTLSFGTGSAHLDSS